MENNKEKMSDEEIALRLVEIWVKSSCVYIDEVLSNYNVALSHLKENK